MKKFRDFSITRKLLTGFLSMVLIILLVGGVGTIGMIQINSLDSYLYEAQTAPIDDLIRTLVSLYQMRVDAREAIIRAGDAQSIEKLKQDYLTNKDTFTSESKAYRQTIATPASIALFDEADDIFTNIFVPTIDKTFELAKSGKQTEAMDTLSASTEKIELMFQNYDKLVENRMASAKKTSESNDRTAITLSLVLGVIIVLGAGVAIFAGLKISRMISNPIGQVVDASKKIALGYVDIDLGNINSKDETGQLADAFREMLESIRKQVLIAESISNGDFTKDVPLRSNGDVLGLALQKIKTDLNRTLLLINIAAEQVNTGASQVSTASQSLASGAAEQAATVEELTASITTVAKQADDNAKNVKQATEYVERAGAGVSESNNQMRSLTTAMDEIRESSKKISDITKVIEDIAFQTNILALNAAIEAARAGTVGKGFAVVADEVRNLAAKSAEAAKQTAQLIQRSTQTVAEGDKMALKTAELLSDVAEKAAMVEQTIRQIEEASSEQAGAIEQITLGISQVSAVVQTNAATAEESSASSEELAAQAQTLQSEVARFKLSQNAGSYNEPTGMGNSFIRQEVWETDAEGSMAGKY